MFDFVFVTCQPACQKWLKEEVRVHYPELRFAFSRPGLVTFKSKKSLPVDFEPRLGFARNFGFSLGFARDKAEMNALLAGLPEPRQRHLFHPPRAEGSDENEAERLVALGVSLGANTGLEPEPGEWVVDCIAGEAEEPMLIGIHRHRAGRSPWPGGARSVPAPDHSPSRAYSKIEEAIAWQRLDVRAGQWVLELGAAPGGAVLAMLERGLNVVALDPAKLDPRLADRAEELGVRLVHLEKPAGALRPQDLPAPIDWLLSDMNLAPQVVVHTVERLSSSLRRQLRGAVITLKMNDARAVAAIGPSVARLEGLGLGRAEVGQLPSHRSEFAVVLRG